MSILGLHGREPVGAVMCVGIKGPTGAPTQTNRYFFVQPKENQQGIRELHPAFAAFNAAPDDKIPLSVRQTITGVLVHASQAQCLEYGLRAQVLSGRPGHPNKRPVCSGDGITALRWTGKDPDDFARIPCPNEKCPYRQADAGKKKACGPNARFMFRPVWKAGSTLPTPLVKFTTNAWSTTSNIVGFFDYIKTQAALLGIPTHHHHDDKVFDAKGDARDPGLRKIGYRCDCRPEINLYGLTFTMTLSSQTNAVKQQRFPVTSLSPALDLQAFIIQQDQRRADMLAAHPVMALTDGEEQDFDVRAADYETNQPGIPRKEE